MAKKAIKKVAATVVHPETGKEFEVTHQIDIQEWLDIGYEIKGEKKAKQVEQKTEPEKTNPDKTEPEKTGSDDETSYDEMSDEDFIEAVKDQLHDLKADDAKRVAQIVGIEYTNKKDTMNAVQDKWAEDL